MFSASFLRFHSTDADSSVKGRKGSKGRTRPPWVPHSLYRICVLQTSHPSPAGDLPRICGHSSRCFFLQESGTARVYKLLLVFQTGGPGAPSSSPASPLCFSSSLGQHRLRTTAQCPGIPPPQPPRLLIYILHSDWPESSLLFMILPDTMVRGGVHIVFSPTWLDFSVKPAKPCLGMFKDLSLFCLEV